jgi:glycosyltransferase involved in cell wall biosynthesis
LVKALVSRGHVVHVTAPGLDQELASKLRALGATPHAVSLDRTGLTPVADLRYFRAMRRLMRQIGPDMVLSYTIKPNIWASLAARTLGIPSASMVTGLGQLLGNSSTARGRLASLASRMLYRLATSGNQVVIFQNPDDRAEFIERGWLGDPSKARLVNGSGVDMDWFAPAPLPDAPVFLMICRLIAAKGVRVYAEAAARILASGRNVRFLLVGFLDGGPDGINPAELRTWQTAGLEYLGHLEDVRPAIASSSVYVLPSYYGEGIPRSSLEAMAMGRPIITTDMPGCRETVVDEVSGLLVPPRDSIALAQAMQRLIDQPHRRAPMGERSLALCRSKFDVRLVNEAMLRHLSVD